MAYTSNVGVSSLVLHTMQNQSNSGLFRDRKERHKFRKYQYFCVALNLLLWNSECRTFAAGSCDIQISIIHSMALTAPKVCSIKASKEEVRRGRLSEKNLETAVRHLYHDGLVVVEDVIEHSVLDHLNEKMVQDALLLSGRGEKSPFNYNKGNLQQDAPPVKEYFEPSIFLSTYSIRSAG